MRIDSVTPWYLITLASILSLGSNLAIGAEPPADAMPSTSPATAPSTVPSSLPTGELSIGPATRSASISLNFKDAPLDVVLDHLSEAAGFVIIREVPVDGRVSIQSTQPVSPEEAVTLLNAVLKSSNFSAIQKGRTLRILSRDKARKANVPVHIGSNPEEIPDTDEIITQVMPLKNVDAIKLRQDLKPVLGDTSDVAASASSNTIVMTDSSSNIRRIAQIIAAMDQGDTSSTDLKLIHLLYANAATTAKLISSMFQSESGGAMTPQQKMMMQQMQQQQGQPPGGAGDHEGRIPLGPIDQALRSGHVHADSDERTNVVILTAPSATMKVIEDIIKQLDSNPEPASEMRTFHLAFADPDDTVKLLNSLLKGSDGSSLSLRYLFGGGGGSDSSHGKVNIAADDRTGSVIVSAPSEVLKTVESLLKDIDASPGTGAEIRTYQLKHATALDASLLVDSIFNPESKDKGAARPIGYLILPGAENPRGPKVVTTFDDRTNTLIVTGPKEALKMIDDLITKIDSNDSPQDSLFIYHLRNAQAANLETVLATLFGNTSTQNNNQNPNANPNGQLQQQQQQQQNQRNGQSGGLSSARTAGTGLGTTYGGRNGQGGQVNGQRSMPHLNGNLAKAVGEMSGQVYVVADNDTNSLLVTTATKYKDDVHAIIEELDRPAPQVLIKVLLAEVTLDNSTDRGLDFSVLNRRPNGNGEDIGVNLGNAAVGMTTGGLVANIVENNVTATLHALATHGKLDVLSRPYILASDNQLATITVGQEVPFITDTRTTDTGQTINTIQYQDVGIILDVTPHINPEGLVILDVAPEISELTGTTVPIGAGVAAPVIAKRSAQSRVAIRDGQTIVIGGLMEDRKTLTVTKVPILGDIPFAGELFKRTIADKTKTELLIFLTPHVAKQPDLLKGMSTQEIRGTRLTPHAVSPGAFQEHMDGMDRGNIPQTQPLDPSATQPVRSIRGE